MIITDLSQSIETTGKHSVLCLSGSGERHREEMHVLREHWVEIALNDRPVARILCTPRELPALILGHLYTAGLISRPEAVAAVSVSQDGTQGCVYAELLPEAARPSNGSGAREEASRETDPPLWKPEWILETAAAFAQGAPLYNLTRGAHSCRLLTEGKIAFTCEDIGRHNAIDKAIGHALIGGIDLKRSILFSSGRVQSDIVKKLMAAGIPLIASNTVPTDRAVALAAENNIGLICLAKETSMFYFPPEQGADPI